MCQACQARVPALNYSPSPQACFQILQMTFWGPSPGQCGLCQSEQDTFFFLDVFIFFSMFLGPPPFLFSFLPTEPKEDTAFSVSLGLPDYLVALNVLSFYR